MRYCGNCGVSLSPDAFDIYAGHSGNVCPSCGAAISPTDNIESANTIDVALESTRQPLAALDEEYFSALPTSLEHSDSGPRTIVTGVRRIAVRPIALLALLVLALLLVFGSVLLLNNAPGHPQLGLPLLILGGSGSQSTATLSASQAAATNGAQSGPLLSPTGSPSTGTPVSGTPEAGTSTPDATVTITPAPGQPSLTVTPTKVSNLVCLGSSIKLTVTNTGEGAMAWSASGSRAAYKMSPQSGSLDSGQQQTVTVSGISANGQVTVTAPGAANSPQSVTITCTL